MSDRELHVERVPLSSLQGATRNPRQHDQDSIAKSVSRFGLVEVPVLDDRTGRLVAGHGRLADLARRKAAGDSPPAGVAAVDDDWLVPVLRGWASTSDSEADGYLVASNEVGSRSVWEEAGLAQIVGDIARHDQELLSFVGLDAGTVDGLLRKIDFYGSEAVSFLADAMQAPTAVSATVSALQQATQPDPTDDSHVATAPSDGPAPSISIEPGEKWLVLTWTLREADALVVRDAVTTARRMAKTQGVEATQADALLSVARFYVQAMLAHAVEHSDTL